MTQHNPTPHDREAAAVEEIFDDLRDRKFLSYLFSAEPETCGAYGYIDAPLDRYVQDEIAEKWRSILARHAAEVREECAKIAERTKAADDIVQRSAGCATTGQRIAAAIRAGGRE